MTGIRNCEKELNWEAGASPAASIKTDKPRAGGGDPGFMYKGGGFCRPGLGTLVLDSLEGWTFQITVRRESPIVLGLHHSSPMPQDWLTRYGYLPPADPSQAQLQSLEKLQDAIKVMQRFAGLPETGQMGR